MAEVLTSLWPKEIAVDTVPPHMVLLFQAEELTKATRGLLVGAVQTSPTRENEIVHTLAITASQLDRAYFEILSVTHHPLKPYPVKVAAIGSDERISNNGAEYAVSQAELTAILAKVFRSEPVLSIIHSLIARINENKG